MALDPRFRVGELRPSQLLFVAGVGGIVDLRYVSVMVMGLDDWELTACHPLSEPRLLQAVQRRLPKVTNLRMPPVLADDSSFNPNPISDSPSLGVPVATFPRWALCPECRFLAPLHPSLFQLKEGRWRPEDTCYVHKTCDKSVEPRVVPGRFLVACNKGHLDDFPWNSYVHGGDGECPGPLFLNESGITGEAGDVFVECRGCRKGRSMASAFDPDRRKDLSRCRGRRPHLRDFQEGGCGEEVRTLMLGATNAWFPISYSALSLPVSENPVEQLVEANWPKLEKSKSIQIIEYLIESDQLPVKLAQHGAEAIWKAVEKRRADQPSGDERDDIDLKTPEWETFSRPDPKQNTDDFKVEPAAVPATLNDRVQQVVKLPRLREVRALVGFTRIDSPGTFDEDPDLPVTWAPLARRAPTWVPAAETRGEGLFLHIRLDALATWEKDVQQRTDEFHASHAAWRRMRHIEPPGADFPGPSYVLIHTLSHALMRQLSLECGYSSASIRERIYVTGPGAEGEPQAGLLLYTAASDSEGTLGGLVRLGDPELLAELVASSLREMMRCSSDPLCAEHRPARDGLTLHGAACHACLFVSETSCERGNRYLDRSLLVPTMHASELAFFGEKAWAS